MGNLLLLLFPCLPANILFKFPFFFIKYFPRIPPNVFIFFLFSSFFNMYFIFFSISSFFFFSHCSFLKRWGNILFSILAGHSLVSFFQTFNFCLIDILNLFFFFMQVVSLMKEIFWFRGIFCHELWPSVNHCIVINQLYDKF